MFKWLSNLFGKGFKVKVDPKDKSLVTIEGTNYKLIKEINQFYATKIATIRELLPSEKKILAQVQAKIKGKTKKQQISILKRYKLRAQITADKYDDAFRDNNRLKLAISKIKSMLENELANHLDSSLNQAPWSQTYDVYNKEDRKESIRRWLQISELKGYIKEVTFAQEDLFQFKLSLAKVAVTQKILKEVEGKSTQEINAEYGAIPGAGGLSLFDEHGQLTITNES
jgi:hypothetical protein